MKTLIITIAALALLAMAANADNDPGRAPRPVIIETPIQGMVR